jgi:hypothetical protein
LLDLLSKGANDENRDDRHGKYFCRYVAFNARY